MMGVNVFVCCCCAPRHRGSAAPRAFRRLQAAGGGGDDHAADGQGRRSSEHIPCSHPRALTAKRHTLALVFTASLLPLQHPSPLPISAALRLGSSSQRLRRTGRRTGRGREPLMGQRHDRLISSSPPAAWLAETPTGQPRPAFPMRRPHLVSSLLPFPVAWGVPQDLSVYLQGSLGAAAILLPSDMAEQLGASTLLHAVRTASAGCVAASPRARRLSENVCVRPSFA